MNLGVGPGWRTRLSLLSLQGKGGFTYHVTSMSPPVRLTMRKLAASAGVSHVTVSRALRNDPSISRATTRRIQALARRLGYRPNPLVLSCNSPGLQLLQRVRDEAHRFAVGYHTGVRKKSSFTSALDGISGIGPMRKRALLRRFGSVNAIRQATIEDLLTVPGVTRGLAERVKSSL